MHMPTGGGWGKEVARAILQNLSAWTALLSRHTGPRSGTASAREGSGGSEGPRDSPEDTQQSVAIRTRI